jgi:hypothetical protein
MAKKQQGFQLPEDVIAWIQEEELRTGASLSRIALAAFCGFVNKPESSRIQDMRAAVWVERGKCAFKNVPLIELEHTIKTYEVLLKTAKTKEEKEEMAQHLKDAKSRLDKFLENRKLS